MLSRPVKIVLQSLAIGWVATQALDWLSVALYESESEEERAAEDRARGNKHAYEIGVERICDRLGIQLSREEVAVWGWRFHKSVGLSAGLFYSVLRRRFPKLGLGYGLAFGATFFFLVDEIMTPLLGMSAGPQAYSWKVHARGAVAHIGYGVAAETAFRATERIEHAKTSAA